MYLVQGLENEITNQLRQEEANQQATRTPSGKLSASMLGEPLQWQVLKSLGLGTRQVEDYVLRKFERGRDTEKWFLNRIARGVQKTGATVFYKGAIGVYDALIDTTAYNGKFGVIPLEVKSVTNAKFKHIEKSRAPDENHLLQGAFYALALETDQFALSYIASDDYRTLTWLFETQDYKDEIDKIIERYNVQMSKQKIPIFEPRYKWQATKDYNKYPEWQELDDKAIKLALDSFYPDAWKNYAEKIKNSKGHK